MSAPAPLDFHVSHVTSKDDIPGLVLVESQAFQSSPIMKLMYPPDAAGLPAGLIARSMRNHRTALETDTNARYLKAALPDGTIIGMAKWYIFPDAVAAAETDPWALEYTVNSNVGLCRFFFGSMNSARRERLGKERHMLMATLVVAPEYQRMGIGMKLLEWGLQKADEEQLNCWIDASPFGLGLYKKVGWKEVGKLNVDLGQFGGEEGKVRTTVHMVRAPKAR
jgi:GNAT superfamily N-acetyltransferase